MTIIDIIVTVKELATSPKSAVFLFFLLLYMSDDGNTKQMPNKISVASPTKNVEESGNFSKHFIMITRQPEIGPIENPAISAGISEIWISRKDGNINGNGNLMLYNTNANAEYIASFTIYSTLFLPSV